MDAVFANLLLRSCDKAVCHSHVADIVLLPAVNYRKSLSADSAFPACLIDALAGYVYVIEQLGFKAEVSQTKRG
jgi:hypothetical protein